MSRLRLKAEAGELDEEDLREINDLLLRQVLDGKTVFCKPHDQVHQYMPRLHRSLHARLSVRFSIKEGNCMSPLAPFPCQRRMVTS